MSLFFFNSGFIGTRYSARGAISDKFTIFHGAADIFTALCGKRGWSYGHYDSTRCIRNIYYLAPISYPLELLIPRDIFISDLFVTRARELSHVQMYVSRTQYQSLSLSLSVRVVTTKCTKSFVTLGDRFPFFETRRIDENILSLEERHAPRSIQDKAGAKVQGHWKSKGSSIIIAIAN